MDSDIGRITTPLRSFEEIEPEFVGLGELEKSEEFQKLSKKEKIARVLKWADDTDELFKGMFGYNEKVFDSIVERASQTYKRLQQLPDDPEPKPIKNNSDSSGNAIVDFGKDLLGIGSAFVEGFNSTTDQMRIPVNLATGDTQEALELAKRTYDFPKAKTAVGGVLQDVAGMLPFIGINTLASVGGGVAGSIAGPIGTTTGAISGGFTSSGLQAFGDSYQRLIQEGVEPDDAATISMMVAPAVAGVELLQLRKIPGLNTLAEKYLTKPLQNSIIKKMTDKAFAGKVSRALGEYATKVGLQAQEEGIQEGLFQAGVEYGKGNDLTTATKNIASAAGRGFVESLAPMAIIQSPSLAKRILPKKGSKESLNDSSELSNDLNETNSIVEKESQQPSPDTPIVPETAEVPTYFDVDENGNPIVVEPPSIGESQEYETPPLPPEGTPHPLGFYKNEDGEIVVSGELEPSEINNPQENVNDSYVDNVQEDDIIDFSKNRDSSLSANTLENKGTFPEDVNFSVNNNQNADDISIDSEAKPREQIINEASESLKDLMGVIKKSEPVKRLGRLLKPNVKLPNGIKIDKKSGQLKGFASMAEIRRYLSNALNIGVHSGMDARTYSNAKGIYHNLAEIVRLRRGHLNDIETVAHEVGHHLERILFKYKINSSDSPMTKELEAFCRKTFGEFGYPAKLWKREGWAQFISEYLSNPVKAKINCPVTYEVMNQIRQNDSKLDSILGNAQVMIALNNSADPETVIAGNIRKPSDTKELQKPDSLVREYWYKAQLFFNDRYYALKRVQRKINMVNGNDAMDSYEQMRLARSFAVQNSEYSMEVNQVDLNGNVVGKCLNDIVSPKNTGISIENFNVFLVARRVVEAVKNNECSEEECYSRFGIHYDNAEAVLNKATEKTKKAGKEIDVFVKNVAKLLLDGGIISLDHFKNLQNRIAYIPLHRFMEEIEGKADSLHKMLGSDREIIDPLITIAENERLFRTVAGKNQILFDAIKSITGVQGYGQLISEYKDITKAVKPKYEELADTLVKSEFIKDWIRRESGNENMSEKEMHKYLVELLEKDKGFIPLIFMAKAEKDDANRILTIFIKGTEYAYQVHDKFLYRSFKNFNELSSKLFKNLVGKFFKSTARMQRGGAVLNPDFFMGNLFRDSQSLIFSRYAKLRKGWILRPIYYLLKDGIPASLGWRKELRKEWENSGGSLGSFYGNDNPNISYGENVRDNMELHNLNLSGKLKKYTKDYLENAKNVLNQNNGSKLGLVKPVSDVLNLTLTGLEKLGSATEKAPRIAEYSMGKADYEEANKGLPLKENEKARRKIAIDSRDVTLDFDSGGEISKLLNQFIPFFNATVLGNNRALGELIPIDFEALADYFSSSELNDFGKDFNALISASKGKALRSGDLWLRILAFYAIYAVWRCVLDNYDDDEDIADWEKSKYLYVGNGYRVPLAPDVAIPFKFLEGVFSNGLNLKKNPTDAALAWQMLLDSAPTAFPPVIKAIVETCTGYSMFKKKQLEGFGQQNILPYARTNPSTTSTAIKASEMLSGSWLEWGYNKFGINTPSPIIIENIVQNVFAGLGLQVLKLSDRILNPIIDAPEAPDRGLKGIPGLGAFARDTFSSSPFVSKFAKIRNEMTQLLHTKNLVSDGRIHEISLSKNDIKKLEYYDSVYVKYQINRVAEILGNYNKQISEIRHSKQWNASQKRKMINALVKSKNEIAKKAYLELSYEEYQKRQK